MSAGRAPFPISAPAESFGAPPGPRLPRRLLGALWLLRERELVTWCRRRYGDIFSLHAWPLGLLVVVSDPAEIKRVFTANPAVAHAGDGNAVATPVAGRGSVLLLDGDRHLHRRKLMLPPFHGERLAVYREQIAEITDEEVDRWPLQSDFSMHSAMQSITLKVILRVVFGIDDAARGAKLERLIPKMINSPALLWPPLQHNLGPWSPWRRFLALREKVDTLLYEEIDRKREDPRLHDREDVLSLLLQARDETDEAMGDEELRDQLVTLLLAGHETSATSLTWTFERLLRNPAVLARLREKLGAGDEDYLDCVLKESLRSRPIVPYAMRRLTGPLEVGGYPVPAGAFLGISTTLVHNRPDLYPDPEVFRPERFEDRRADTYTWVPFGGGVRRCLGAAFATFEMKTVLRRVIERCELDAPDPRPERPRQRFVTLIPDRGGRVSLRQRRSSSGSSTAVPEMVRT